jgi:hypothetical protein
MADSDDGCVDRLQGFEFWMGKEGAAHAAGWEARRCDGARTSGRRQLAIAR